MNKMITEDFIINWANENNGLLITRNMVNLKILMIIMVKLLYV